jgi:uncharacterized cupin superfamily protein
VRRVNLDELEPDFDPEDPPGFRAGATRIGRLFEASKTGASLYEIPPGEALCPYHYEYGEEEWVLVLAGRATVRTPAGNEDLGPGELAFFETGPDGAHQIRNEGGEPLRALMFSNFQEQAATVYPDSDKIGVWTGRKADEALFRRADAVDYYDGER